MRSFETSGYRCNPAGPPPSPGLPRDAPDIGHLAGPGDDRRDRPDVAVIGSGNRLVPFRIADSVERIIDRFRGAPHNSVSPRKEGAGDGATEGGEEGRQRGEPRLRGEALGRRRYD